MKWLGRRESDNVEDRRGMSSGGKVALGGGGLAIIFFVLKMFMGGDNAQLLDTIENQLEQQSTTQTVQKPLTEEQIQTGKFVKTVFADTEDIWTTILQENNMQYTLPKMVLFTENVDTACGSATSASGPFYCPGDQKVYMDLDFFEELKTRFGAKGGDFATAYVIAHEVGHHIQNLLGTSSKVREMQEGISDKEANKLSVALELQADFYAGIWAHYNQKYIEPGDIEEALSAANAVGDDAIQKKMQGQAVPDSFTHGTSAQRMYWFNKGYKSGNIKDGDTFAELK